MSKVARISAAVAAALLLAGLAVSGVWRGAERAAMPQPAAPLGLQSSAPAAPSPRSLPDPRPPAVAQVLQSGVLIVVSKGSQRMHVFKDGKPWRSTPVSTGRRGHATPSGVFPILQKSVFHRSNIYSNAPMPFMQRLTWSGIAIHAGRLPGYPASHGCIRVPRAFARSLYALTRFGATTVVVTNVKIGSDAHAQRLALDFPVPAQAEPAVLASAEPSPLPVPDVQPPEVPNGQTIQLAASSSSAEAEAHWTRLVADRPQLAGFRKAVIPAIVNSRRVYRLRASAPGAHAYCTRLQSEGIACFAVS